jgi:hypothetical protein
MAITEKHIKGNKNEIFTAAKEPIVFKSMIDP